MKTGIATVSIAGDFATKLGAIAAAGYDGLEIFEQDFLASDLPPRVVGQMVRDHGLEVLLFQPFRDFEGLPDPLRGHAFTRARRKFVLMNELGTDLMLICSSVHPQSLGGIDRAAEDLAALGAIAAEYGVRVGYEALACPIRPAARPSDPPQGREHPVRPGRQRAILSTLQSPLRRRAVLEIVQRTDRYDGYGAPNAPFRIAAQARLGQPVTIPKR